MWPAFECHMWHIHVYVCIHVTLEKAKNQYVYLTYMNERCRCPLSKSLPYLNQSNSTYTKKTPFIFTLTYVHIVLWYCTIHHMRLNMDRSTATHVTRCCNLLTIYGTLSHTNKTTNEINCKIACIFLFQNCIGNFHN